MSFEAMNWCREITAGRSSDKSVLLALAMSHNGDSGRCDPSIEFLSSFTELNRKTVIASLNRLQINGFIDFDSGKRSRRNYSLQFSVTGEGKSAGVRPDYHSNFGTLNNTDRSKIGTLNKPDRPKIGTLGRGVETPYRSKNDRVTSQIWNTKDSKDINLINTTSTPVAEGEKKTPNGDYLKAAQAMHEKIATVKKRKSKPNLERWANDIRKLVEIDEVDPETVWRVFLWAHNDNFWRPNILSPGKLREKFDTLYAKMGNDNAERNGNDGNRRAGIQPNDGRRLTPAQRIAARRATLGG
jgi:pyocin large subunit-like protein